MRSKPLLPFGGCCRRFLVSLAMSQRAELMAKRELSSTLKNLKFMQRAAEKETKAKEVEEIKPNADFGASPIPARRCIVIMEGDPHPGAVRGRMSFQGFNPNIEKLNEEAKEKRQRTACATNNKRDSESVNEAAAKTSRETRIGGSNTTVHTDLKGKEPEIETENTSTETLQKNHNKAGEHSSSSKKTGSNIQKREKREKREKLDWNVLRPPKYNKNG